MRSSAVPKFSLQVGEDAEDLRLDDHVERRRRLVGDEELRPEHERERDHDPLPHPARELVRVLAEAGRRDPHPPERLERAACGPPGRSRPGSCCSSVSRKWSSIRMSGFKPRHRLLEDEAEVGPPQPPQLPATHPDEVPPAVEHLAVGDGALGEQSEDAASERRLAAARLADEPQHLALADVERNPVDRAHGAPRRAVVHAQVAHGDDGCRAHRRLRARLGARLEVDLDVRAASAAPD